MNHNQTISAIRKVASPAGLSFRKMKKYKDNKPQYDFIDTESRRVVMDWLTLETAYENVCSGYIESYDPATESFKGV